MLTFFNRRKDPPQFSWLKKDIHAHLLPGIDDGSPNVETSLRLIRGLYRAGIHEFVCTPHIIGDTYRNTPDTIHQALLTLQEAVAPEFPDVKISAAAEYLLDDYFMELLQSGNRLLTVQGDYILTEFSYSIEPSNIREIVFDLINAGYLPILAHPERYSYFHGNERIYVRLKELGFLFQMNLLSLVGYYGNKVRKAAQMLLREGMIDFVGTDLHHENHLRVLTDPKSMLIFQDHFAGKLMNELERREL